MIRRLYRAAAVVVVAVLVGACTGDDGSVTPAPRRAPERPPVADYGLLGASCGEVARTREGDVPDGAVQCLLGAVAEGRQAHLVVTGGTVEGDPVFRAYQVEAKDQLAVVHDARWDGFGSGRITRQRCGVGSVGGHVAVQGDAGAALRLVDCR